MNLFAVAILNPAKKTQIDWCHSTNYLRQEDILQKAKELAEPGDLVCTYDVEVPDESFHSERCDAVLAHATYAHSRTEYAKPCAAIREALIKSKAHIRRNADDNYSHTYICYALGKTDAPEHDIELARAYILQKLAPAFTFGEYRDDKRLPYYDLPTAEQQALRLAWLDNLIGELENAP